LSLTRINMPMIEHLMYQKKMVYAWWSIDDGFKK
jgi:hypothetical protein